MPQLSLFYHEGPLPASGELELDEDNARHIVQALRMEPGDGLELTNGAGLVATAAIARISKKKCTVQVDSLGEHPLPQPSLHLAIAFTRHTGRNEWLLEKATELGVRSIIPLQTARSERERFRPDRWQAILAAAMIQSRQYYLPRLEKPVSLAQALESSRAGQKLIAHCMPGTGRRPMHQVMTAGIDLLVCIGPEGDFTEEEVNLAMAAGCRSISLGTTRLRTETAAMAACAFFHLKNDKTI